MSVRDGDASGRAASGAAEPSGSDAVKRAALALGFDAVGITTLDPVPHGDALDRWLAAGYAAEMRYLPRQVARRREPQRVWPQARSAVVTLTNYWHGAGAMPRRPSAQTKPRVAQYAWSTDYHRVLGARLARLADAIRDHHLAAQTRCYVDAGPLPERELAQRAGLGWIAKNTMLIHPRHGSFTFIGVVLTDAPLAPDAPFTADRCGRCRACLDACPTQAFPTERVLDARRCISYLTIERRGEFTEIERAQTAEWLFGCDACQDVCPWNLRFATPTADGELAPRAELRSPDVMALRNADTDTFAAYADTAFARAGVAGMRRNAAAVLVHLRRP